MRARLLSVAALAALAMPQLAHADVSNWRKAVLGEGTKMKRWRTSARRDAGKLQLNAWNAPPCEAPDGYFWHRTQRAGFHPRYWLKKCAPGERTVIEDKANGRRIIFSGWGYVKPTYEPA